MAWRSSLSRNVKELRVLMCQTSEESAGLRNFVAQTYKDLKTANPALPILVRESAGIEPRLVARYDFGVENVVSVKNMDAKAIEKQLEELNRIGSLMPRAQA